MIKSLNNYIKRLLSGLLVLMMMWTLISPTIVNAENIDSSIEEISNEYIKVTVSKENGGYVIATKEGDVIKKSDNNKDLTHRGNNYDSSFTTFRIDGKDYIFGSKYDTTGMESTAVSTLVNENGNEIASVWEIGKYRITQLIQLVNSEISQQLGTALITYIVKNEGTGAINVKSRMLMDTQLGDQDYGYYELPKQKLGQGYECFEYERTWDSTVDPTVEMPSDYFVRDERYSSKIVGYGVNSVFKEQKPYKMTFAHWANIASTTFDYEPDSTLNFTNPVNNEKTADSAVALYYDIGKIEANSAATFSTYYGVNANVKNKNNRLMINVTAPSSMEFNDNQTAYIGTSGKDDGIVRINASITNPADSEKTYSKLRVAVYTLDFNSRRQNDSGGWTAYDNSNPLYTEILDLTPGDRRTTYFDFKLTPEDKAQMGTYIIRVYDMDEDVNELGAYAEEFTLATSENYIVMPGKDPTLPPITLNSLSPAVSYNDEIRYLTITGTGMRFLKSDLLDHIELRNETTGRICKVSRENLAFEQGDDPNSVTLMLDEYMEPGKYSLHFMWNNGKGSLFSEIKNGIARLFDLKNDSQVISNLPADFTSVGMKVSMSSDKTLKNDRYGLVTVQRDEKDKEKYKVVGYRTEDELEAAEIDDENLLLSLRGDIQQDKENKKIFRLVGKDKDVTINNILNYHGSDLCIEEYGDGSAVVLMDGIVTTLGANTTVRKGTSAFRLKEGTEYVVPVYDESGEIQENDTLVGHQDYIRLKWDNAIDTLMTMGGFLVDLKFGVLGKIIDDNGTEKDESDDTTSDIISFGGGLDLSFMTPGGAETARNNTKEGGFWTSDTEEIKYDDTDDGLGFGLDFDEESGEFKSQQKAIKVKPKNEDSDTVSVGATIHDILYGGEDPGYIGINMEASIELPQFLAFMPNSLSGELSINTIDNYEVGVKGEAELATFSLAFSLVIKGNDKGAPIPDSLYFALGGFEPGVNVDGMGIFWLTGAGGGFSDLYDTIYGFDGMPPLTLLLHAEFDITKILTGSADLSLSLRSISLEMSDVSLKALKQNNIVNASFLEKGLVAIGWSPNFSFELEADVNFISLFSGLFKISAAAGKKVDDFVEFVLCVAIGLPEYIPLVGGMQIASAELGGGSEKVWGSIELLEMIKVGFTYYWGGDVEFTHGSSGGTENLARLSSDEGEAERAFNELTGVTSTENQGEYIKIGGNLDFVASSRVVGDIDSAYNKKPAILMSDSEENQNEGDADDKNKFELLTGLNLSMPEVLLKSSEATQIYTNAERTEHIVYFAGDKDYILSISHNDGSDVTVEELKNALTVSCGDTDYPLFFYNNPGKDADDEAKTDALKNANINVSAGDAWLAIPKEELKGQPFTLAFNNEKAYDVGVVRVQEVGTLTECSSSVNDHTLNINWKGENLSKDGEIIALISDESGSSGSPVNTKKIFAVYDGDKGSASIELNEELSCGNYNVTLVYSDEDVCYDEYPAGTITLNNEKAPQTPASVTVSNNGSYKLAVDVDMPENAEYDGYLLDVYQSDGTLADSGLYFEKGEEIIIGGKYSMPVLDDKGTPVIEDSGKDVKTVTAGYTPGESYSVKVRAANLDSEGVYNCSSYITSTAVVLKDAQPPKTVLNYDKKARKLNITSDVPIIGDLYLNNKLIKNFDTMSNTQSCEIKLEDGTHTFEFHATDKENDKAIVSTIEEIDTTPPVILMESPVSGGVFGGKILNLKAESEPDLNFEFYIDGEKVNPINSDVTDGSKLDCKLPIEDKAGKPTISVKMVAQDKAGNKAEKNLLLTNEKISGIKSLRLRVGNQKDEFCLTKDEKQTLTVIGIHEDGSEIDITGLENTIVELCGGSSVNINQGEITALSSGNSMVRAEFDLGGGNSLVTAAVVKVGENINSEKLNEAITEALAKSETDYSEISWSDLSKALLTANKVIGDVESTQLEINNAEVDLRKAISELEPENPYDKQITVGKDGSITVNYYGKKAPKVIATLYKGKRMVGATVLKGDSKGHYTGILKGYDPGMSVRIMFLKPGNYEAMYYKIEK